MSKQPPVVLPDQEELSRRFEEFASDSATEVPVAKYLLEREAKRLAAGGDSVADANDGVDFDFDFPFGVEKASDDEDCVCGAD